MAGAEKVRTAGSNLALKPILLHLLCMTLCTPFHPDYRGFLMDVFLSLLSDPLLLLWDEALFVCAILSICTVKVWSQFDVSILWPVNYRLHHLTW